MRYLSSTLHLGIHFRSGPLHLSTYCDVDWAGDPIDRRSITGMVVFLGNSPITWSAKKQSVVSRSSTKVEYRFFAITTTELYWLRMLLKDLGIYLYHPPILWCDNVSALASSSIFHARTTLIEVDYHFIREKVLNRDMIIKYISDKNWPLPLSIKQSSILPNFPN